MDFMTEEQFKEALPAGSRKSVNKDVLDIINSTLSDPDARDAFRENLVTYTSVLTQGKFKLPGYIDAVKYVTHKLLGNTNITSYTKAFPQKIMDFRARGIPEKDIHSYVAAYNGSKLVNLIMAQTMIPTHVLNADIYQEAINIQLNLARNAQSEKVKSDAANSLMVQLRPPEIKKVELDIGLKESDALKALKEASMTLLTQQKAAIQAGITTAQDTAHSSLVIEGELDEQS